MASPVSSPISTPIKTPSFNGASATVDRTVYGWTRLEPTLDISSAAILLCEHEGAQVLVGDSDANTFQIHEWTASGFVTVGSAFDVTTLSSPHNAISTADSVFKIAPNVFVWIDHNSDGLVPLILSGGTLTAGNIFTSIDTGGYAHGTYLGGSFAALWSTTAGDATLSKLQWDGSDISVVGNSLTIAGVGTYGFPIGMTETRLTFYRTDNDTAQLYDHDGTDWSTTGNATSIGAMAGVFGGGRVDEDTVFLSYNDDFVGGYTTDETDFSLEGVAGFKLNQQTDDPCWHAPFEFDNTLYMAQTFDDGAASRVEVYRNWPSGVTAQDGTFELQLDANQTASYPGSGNYWYNIAPERFSESVFVGSDSSGTNGPDFSSGRFNWSADTDLMVNNASANFPLALRDAHKTSGGGVTIGITFYLDTLSVDKVLLANVDGGESVHGFKLQVESDGSLTVTTQSGSSSVTTTVLAASSITTDTFHTLVIGWDMSTGAYRVYLNSKTVTNTGTASPPTTTTNPTNAFVVGNRPSGDQGLTSGDYIQNVHVDDGTVDDSAAGALIDKLNAINGTSIS